MSDAVVGMMFSHDEGDILEEVLEESLNKVDSWFISNDNSTDGSWDIIQDFKRRHPGKIEYVRNKREDPRDQGQRQSLLNEIRKRYKPENTWVQILDADMMIVDTDVREAIKNHAKYDLGVTWNVLHAVRKQGTWNGVDVYPNWVSSIREVLPYADHAEYVLYTFRPLPLLEYDLNTWRPWPQGFGQYLQGKPLMYEVASPDFPLLAHYGYRGPKHFYEKYAGRQLKKYPWDTSSVSAVEDTVWYFNGYWNANVFPMSRKGWELNYERY